VPTLALALAWCLVAGEPSAFDLFRRGEKAEQLGHMSQAYLLYSEAAALEPNNQTYWLRSQAVRARAVLEQTLLPKSRTGPPLAPAPTWDAANAKDFADLKRLLPPPALKAAPSIKDFDLRGDSKLLYETVAKAFGLDCVFDGDYVPRPGLHFSLDAVDYREALHGLELATGTFIVPLSEKIFMVVQDTQQKRSQNEPYMSVAIPLPEALNQQDFTSLVQAVQQTMGIQKVSFDNSTNTIVLRDQYSKVMPAQALLQDLLLPRSQVMVEMKLIQVTENDMVTYGMNFPDIFSLTPLTNWLGNQYQLPTSITGLLRFGAGKSLIGLGIMNASLVAQMSNAHSTTFVSTELRGLNALPASIHIGDRYPIVSSQYSSPPVSTVAGAPVITVEPTGETVTIGSTATFSVSATGTAPLSYQWSQNGTVIAGATASTYTTPAATATENGYTYYVTVSNSVGSVRSTAAVLTVTAATGFPTITTQPQNQTVSIGQTATFSVVATGTAPLAYQWTENGLAIYGATSDSYTTPAVAATDNGSQFAVTVTNTVGIVTSISATLNVSSSVGAPTITTQPQSQTVTVGQTATFSVAVTGTAPFAYQWYENRKEIDGATSSTYTTPDVASTDSGSTFTVEISNSVGSVTSSPATLTVTTDTGAPAITTQPQSQTIAPGQTATFYVDATGTAPLVYQWYMNGSEISGATSSSYTTPVTTASNNGETLTVSVTNTVGSVTSNPATLTVSTISTGYSALATIPSFQYVDLGLSLKVTPYVHGDREVTLDVDAQFQLLGGTSVNGVPVITNRALKTTVRLNFGEWAVVSGLLETSDARTIAGLAGVSSIPYLGPLTSTHEHDTSTDRVLLLIRPYLLTPPASGHIPLTLRLGSETRPITPL